jgi:hypothetical protein
MNEVVPDAIDVRIHHQRISEPENQHHPKRRVQKQKVEAKKIREMKKPRGGWNASQRVCAKSLEFVVGRSIRIASAAMVLLGFGGPGTLADNPDLAR